MKKNNFRYPVIVELTIIVLASMASFCTRPSRVRIAGLDKIRITSERPVPENVQLMRTYLSPYFINVEKGLLHTSLVEKDWETAQKLIEKHISSMDASNPMLPKANYVNAYVKYRLKEYEKALELLSGREYSDTVLAQHAGLIAARCEHLLEKHEQAVASARSVNGSRYIRKTACSIAARSLVKMERWEEAADQLQHCLNFSYSKDEEIDLKLELASALLKLAGEPPDEKYLRNAAEILEGIIKNSPLRPLAARAEEIYASLPGKIREKPRAAGPRWVLNKMDEARSLYARARHTQAEKISREIIKAMRHRPWGSLACQARLLAGRALYRKKKRARAAEELAETARRCDDTGVKVKSLYIGAKASYYEKNYKKALVMWEEIEKNFAHHSYADDSRLYRARVLRDMKKNDEAARLLESLPDEYPSGDMRESALWMLAWHFYINKEVEKARDIFKRIYDEGLETGPWHAQGRALYWMGRSHLRLGEKIKARRYFLQTIARHPFSVYMTLALSRICEMDEYLGNEVMSDIKKGGPNPPRWPLSQLLMEAPETVLSGIEMLRMGLVDTARAEFDAAGIGSGAPDRYQWLAARAYSAAGLHNLAVRIPTRSVSEWHNIYPSEDTRELWEMAYPQAYYPIVETASNESAVPVEQILAIMREESRFEPRAVSYANAMGLTQVILPTARRFGRELGLKVTRSTLRDPDTNIRIGAGFMGFLWDRYQGLPPLVAAGYNAGEGAVDRWLKERGDRPLDVFMENIPYQQTRRYTFRVMSSMGIYHYLYSETEPFLFLPFEIPPALHKPEKVAMR